MFFQGEYVYVVFDPNDTGSQIYEVFGFKPDAEHYVETHPGLVIAERKLRPLGWAPDTLIMTRLKILLGNGLTDKGIEQWLDANNRLLGMSPREAMKKDMNKKVFEAAHAFIGGNYV